MDDKMLRDDVLAELDFEPGVEAEGIGVAVHNGVVTLSGQVKTYGEKIRAEEAVRRVKGIRAIAEEITVRGGGDTTDEDLARRAADLLGWIGAVPLDVVAQVEKGTLTLKGEVEHDYQRRIAEQEVRSLKGVTRLRNEITLKSRPAPEDLKRRIEEALARNVVETSGVRLDVREGEVTLTGVVRTWSDREAVERVTWAAPGVRAVDNRLVISEAADPEFIP
jgi:osmotically-inducible protein OsmY